MSLTYAAEGCLRVGQAAPDFTATAEVDQEFKTINCPTIAASMSFCSSTH